MTAKSRRHKIEKKLKEEEPPLKNYIFYRGTAKSTLVVATTEKEAKEKFQERYGYWPE